jgi:hypothetical protein
MLDLRRNRGAGLSHEEITRLEGLKIAWRDEQFALRTGTETLPAFEDNEQTPPPPVPDGNSPTIQEDVEKYRQEIERWYAQRPDKNLEG